ncbi:MAG: hypothetical protein Q9195_006243 [Heterodermia aff. obscurata]
MATGNAAAVSAFIEGAPPGELSDVVTDIKALTADDPSLLQSAQAAYRRYNEEQLVTVKLPGGSVDVLVSSHNSLGGDRYYDVESSSSFTFDHNAQKASSVQSYTVAYEHGELFEQILAFEFLVLRVFSSTISMMDPLKANRNGRWRSTYFFNPSSCTLSGTIKVDVHYYEDGNVRLTTSKSVPGTSISGSITAPEIMKQIARMEKQYQEDLNKGFTALSEGTFKGLRRQLPVTRQKVEWEKVGGYRVSTSTPWPL